MRDDTTTQAVIFKDLVGKPVVARFDQPDSGSNGRAVFLKACDEWLGLMETIASCVSDARQSWKTTHFFYDLVRQLVFGIAVGYQDSNDSGQLAGGSNRRGCSLASQSTLSRLNNALDPMALTPMVNALADTITARHRKRMKERARRITVELDPTNGPTQQLTFFNGHYITWRNLPAAGFVPFDDEPEQYLFAYSLRPDNADAKLVAIGSLRRILPRLHPRSRRPGR